MNDKHLRSEVHLEVMSLCHRQGLGLDMCDGTDASFPEKNQSIQSAFFAAVTVTLPRSMCSHGTPHEGTTELLLCRQRAQPKN